MHVRAVGIVRAHAHMGRVDYVAIREEDIAVFVRAGFRAQLQRAAPIAPHRAAGDGNVAHVFPIPALDAFEHDAIVKIAEKAVGNAYIAAVEQIDAIAVVAPHANRFQPFAVHALAIGQDVGECSAIAGDDAGDFAIFARI